MRARSSSLALESAGLSGPEEGWNVTLKPNAVKGVVVKRPRRSSDQWIGYTPGGRWKRFQSQPEAFLWVLTIVEKAKRG